MKREKEERKFIDIFLSLKLLIHVFLRAQTFRFSLLYCCCRSLTLPRIFWFVIFQFLQRIELELHSKVVYTVRKCAKFIHKLSYRRRENALSDLLQWKWKKKINKKPAWNRYSFSSFQLLSTAWTIPPLTCSTFSQKMWKFSRLNSCILQSFFFSWTI